MHLLFVGLYCLYVKIIHFCTSIQYVVIKRNRKSYIFFLAINRFHNPFGTLPYGLNNDHLKYVKSLFELWGIKQICSFCTDIVFVKNSNQKPSDLPL